MTPLVVSGLVTAWSLLIAGRVRPAVRRPHPSTGLGRAMSAAGEDEAPSASPPADPGTRAARAWLAPVVVAVVTTAALGPVPGGAALGGWAVARHRRGRRRADEAVAAVVDQVPEVIDLLALAVGAGLNVADAIGAVARWSPGRVGDSLVVAHREIAHGTAVAVALERARDRCGPPAAGLFAALIAADRHGSPLADVLDRIARDARADRRRAAEERARKVPVQLLFPLVVCVLPAFALLTVVPLLVSSLGTLS